MTKITIAVIGCGAIAELHFKALSGFKNARIKYAVDGSLERAEKAKADYGCENAVTDYKQALADKEVGAVFILTPNYLHHAITMDALNAGKHIFCEKPIALNYKQAAEMQELANKKNLILDIGVCRSYHPSIEMLSEMAKRGDLGEIYHVYCSFRSHRSIPGLGGSFTTKAKSGGGILIDRGVHFLDSIMRVTGAKVKTVSANCYSKLAKNIKDYNYNYMWAGPPKLDGINDVEEFVTAFIRTDKAGISMNGAWAQNINKSEAFIDFLGDKGGARLEYDNDCGFAKLTLYGSRNGSFEETVPVFAAVNLFEAEDKAFLQSVADGKKNRNHIDNVIETAKAIDAIYESNEKGREITL